MSDTGLFLIILAMAVVIVILSYYACKQYARRRWHKHTRVMESKNDYGREDRPRDW